MQNAEKISITMTSEMMQIIRASVDAGEYASTSEVLRDAFRTWLRERIERAEHLESIKARIKRSVDDPRPSISTEEMKKRLKEIYAKTEKEMAEKEIDNAAA